MTVLAIIATAGAVIWTGVVVLGNYQRTQSEEFLGGGTLVLVWSLTALLWLCKVIG